MINKRSKLGFVDRYMVERKKGRDFISALFSSTWTSLGFTLNTYSAVDPRNQAMRGIIGRQASAADLTASQPYLRNLCRSWERNNATARAAVEGLVANVVGSGIALEPDTGDKAIDAKLRAVWQDYVRDCFIDGTNLYEGQTLAFREVVVAGESLWRLVIDNERMAQGKIPMAVLPLESEWLGAIGGSALASNDLKGIIGGVRLDDYCRPVSYRLLGPSGHEEEVPAKFIIHSFEKRRSLQVRGEPWFAPILTTLKQEQDLVTAELEAAKNTAGMAAAITTHGGQAFDMDEKGSPVRDINIGSIMELQPGESITPLSHTRPSQQIKPFRDMLQGDEAGALRIGKRWLNRDVSAANYSSMRCDMLDNDRLLGPVREWFGNQTVGKLYKAVLPYLAVKAGVKLPNDRYRLLPDGQPYVDPEKDIAAALKAINGGLSSYEEEASKRGKDYKDIWKKLAQEKQEAESMGLVFNMPDKAFFGEDAAVAQKAQDLKANPPPQEPSTGIND